MIHIKYFLNHLFFLILKISFICFFLAPLGLCCCVRVFSSCGEQGLPSSCGVPASHCGGFSCCGARPQWLWPMGLVAPQHVECSQTRDRTCVFCIGRQILNHWTTRKGPYKVLGVAPRKCLLNVQCCCCCWCWYCPAVKSESNSCRPPRQYRVSEVQQGGQRLGPPLHGYPAGHGYLLSAC